jgi:exodeoxyribonuclease-3
MTLNIRHGGSSRIAAIGDYLLSQEADILVCTEARANASGDALAERMQLSGYTAFRSHAADPRQNGVVVFSLSPASSVTMNPTEVDQNRIVACRVGSLTIAGVYFALNHKKATLFDYLLSKPAELGDDYLIIGDFNTGRHRVDEVGATFLCEDRFTALPAAGFHDLWRQSNGEEAREFSWASHRGGKFRLDHAFGSRTAAARLIDCSYDHSTRPGLSDHSALVVNLSDESPPQAETQMTAKRDVFGFL